MAPKGGGTPLWVNGRRMRKARGNHRITLSLVVYMKHKNMSQLSGEIGAETKSGVEPGRHGNMAVQVVSKRKPCIIIATWNVRTMNRAGKVENLVHIMNMRQINVMGICETRWKEPGEFIYDNKCFVHSGSLRGQGGVAVVLDAEMQKSLLEVQVINHRVMQVTLCGNRCNTVIIQVYMPTSSHTDEEVEEIYQTLSDLIGNTKAHDNVIVMGDFNATVGQDPNEEITGKFGLGKKNARGELLIEFCQQERMVITNTFYQTPKRRMYTWTSPADGRRYQIDYILVRKRFRNQVKKSIAYPGMDIDSDHNAVVMKAQLRLKRKTKGQRRKRWHIDRLRDPIIVQQYCEKVTELLSNQEETYDLKNAVEKRWEKIKNAVNTAAMEIVGKYKVAPREKWMTSEILELMDERAKWKNNMTEEGRQRWRILRNQINRKCAREKQHWLNGKCAEIERLDKQGSADKMHREVKNFIHGNKRNGLMTRALKAKDGTMLLEIDKKQKRWKEYIGDLYKAKQDPRISRIEIVESDYLPILREEFDDAVKRLAKGKAAGLDEIPAELIHRGGKVLQDQLYLLVNEIYDSGTWPKDHTRTVMVPIPKVHGTTHCEKHRTISLIVHASKILLRIIKNRIQSAVDNVLSNSQFGFRRGRGTRDAIACLRILAERMIEMNRPLYVAFLDYEKAFDTVPWAELFSLLQTLDIDSRTLRLLENLYINQDTVIALSDGITEPVKIQIGTRQGCLLSPDLFNLYADIMMAIALDDIWLGVKIGGQRVKTIKFADDQAIVAGSAKSLQTMLRAIEKTAIRYGLRINAAKTKTMILSTRPGNLRISLAGHPIEQVHMFKYLGQTITSGARCTEEIRIRLALARAVFQQHAKTLTNGRISLCTRKRLLQTYIWSVALYGAETWTMNSNDKRRLEAFEMWCYRRMLKVSWQDHRTNSSILEETQEQRKILKSIIHRRLKWMGHVLRHGGLLMDIIEGRIEGRRGRGRPRDTFVKQVIREARLTTYEDLKRATADRDMWRVVCVV